MPTPLAQMHAGAGLTPNATLTDYLVSSWVGGQGQRYRQGFDIVFWGNQWLAMFRFSIPNQVYLPSAGGDLLF